MIPFKEAETIHSILIETFGGAPGIRDSNLLISALSRPFQTFESSELYPTIIDKAAALIESVLNNHPFVDGNKRTGYVLIRLLLSKNEVYLVATEQEKYDFVISIASGRLQFEGIVKWLTEHTGKK